MILGAVPYKQGERAVEEYPSADRFGILFVCTGNQCRSPVAEVLVRRLLDERFGSEHAVRFDVSSAGTQAVRGEPIDALTRAELVAVGLDDEASFPDSTPLSVDAISSADLVLTAERAHRGIVVQQAPTALGKTFCLREFARLMASVECDGLPGDPVALARAAVVAARNNRGLIPSVPPSEDDIADPRGLDRAAHHAAAGVISSALAQILGVPSPVVAGSRRRWSRPIRRRTESPGGQTDRQSPEPTTVSSPTAPIVDAPIVDAPTVDAPTVDHDPRPQPSQTTTPAGQDPAPFPDPHPGEDSPPAAPRRSWRQPTDPKPATDASTDAAVETRSLENVQVPGSLDPPHDPTSAEARPVAAVDPRRVPTVMRTSLGLWITSFLAGFVAMALSFGNLRELRAGLEEIARQRQPDVEADVVDQAVNILLYGALGGTVSLISLQVILAVVMGTRRSWARALLTVVAVLSLPVLILTRDVVSGQAGWTLAIEALLILAALGTMFLPGANSWFRQQRMTRRGVHDEPPTTRPETRRTHGRST